MKYDLNSEKNQCLRLVECAKDKTDWSSYYRPGICVLFCFEKLMITVIYIQNFFFRLISNWQCWTPSSVYKMWYGVISVRHRFPLCTVTFVMNIFVKNVWGNISQINPLNIWWFQMKKRALLLYVKKSIPSLFVSNVLLPKITDTLTERKMSSRRI